jgi:transmembrane 9 superfamily protein 2/4
MTDVQIHWFSIINSVIVVFFLAGILSMIIVKTLRRDIARYNQEEAVRCFVFNKIKIEFIFRMM